MIVAATNPGQARRDAQTILDGDAYQSKTGARPLRGVLRWIGDRLDPIGRGAARAWNATLGKLPAELTWLIVIALIVAAIYLLARTAQSRSAARATNQIPASVGDHGPALTAADLDQAAIAAEQRGDLALAIRLRFRAGLLRLDHDAHAITSRPGLTTREVRSILHIDDFDALANTFEDVTYGDKVPSNDDATAARDRWPNVIREASRG